MASPQVVDTAVADPPFDGTTFRFITDEIIPMVHAELWLTRGDIEPTFGGKLRMDNTYWVSFITALQAGAKALGDRVELEKRELKNGVAQ